MAEIEILTENASGDGWVDALPAGVTTGYQAQNTNITARTIGMDMTSVTIGVSDITLEISGPIDVDGIPFAVTTAQVFSFPATSGAYFFRIGAGADALHRAVTLEEVQPVWVETKNGFYVSGDRILNWIISVGENLSGIDVSAVRLESPQAFLGYSSDTSLGAGSHRAIATPGTYVFPVTSPGVYAFTAVGAGGAGWSGSGDGGGGGGKIVTKRRLFLGEKVQLIIGAGGTENGVDGGDTIVDIDNGSSVASLQAFGGEAGGIGTGGAGGTTSVSFGGWFDTSVDDGSNSDEAVGGQAGYILTPIQANSYFGAGGSGGGAPSSANYGRNGLCIIDYVCP